MAGRSAQHIKKRNEDQHLNNFNFQKLELKQAQKVSKKLPEIGGKTRKCHQGKILLKDRMSDLLVKI